MGNTVVHVECRQAWVELADQPTSLNRSPISYRMASDGSPSSRCCWFNFQATVSTDSIFVLDYDPDDFLKMDQLAHTVSLDTGSYIHTNEVVQVNIDSVSGS